MRQMESFQSSWSPLKMGTGAWTLRMIGASFSLRGGLCMRQVCPPFLLGGASTNPEAPGVGCCSPQHAGGEASTMGRSRPKQRVGCKATEKGGGEQGRQRAGGLRRLAVLYSSANVPCTLSFGNSLSFTFLSTLSLPALLPQVTAYLPFQFLFSASRECSLRFPLPPKISDLCTR